jgi:hypothetical protein
MLKTYKFVRNIKYHMTLLELDLHSLKIFTALIYFICFLTVEFYFYITLRGGFTFLQYNFPDSLLIEGL